MPQGQIKKLVSDKGFGFIRDERGTDVFFHASGLEGISFEELQEGQNVEYSTEQGPKGPRATAVRIID
ncbi:MAG: cold shock domain-containing protein [Pirellulaceae bacterium]